MRHAEKDTACLEIENGKVWYQKELYEGLWRSAGACAEALIKILSNQKVIKYMKFINITLAIVNLAGDFYTHFTAIFLF